MNTHLVVTAAALPPAQARAIIELICRDRKTVVFQRRKRLQRRFKRELVRVLKFAKHETLRKLHRHLYTHRPIMGQDEFDEEPEYNSMTSRIIFNLQEFWQDIVSMFATESPVMLESAASDTLAEVGFRDPWRFPAQDTLDYISRRQNLLSNVPNEIFDTIRNEISTGLNAGESIRDLSARISAAFTEIETGRAELIAETETAAAYSYASDKAARAAGIQYKQWIHGASKVPRPDHIAIDGLVVPIDEPYPVGDPQLMYPHDENGSPEDIINCSCVSIAASVADYESSQTTE